MERRLAAILAADVVGFSRLTEADEEGTLLRLKRLRTEVLDPKFAEHHGRIVKLMGDGLLAEFASVVDAVRCAVEIQRTMTGVAAEFRESERIALRIGINLGDIIIDDEDIYGDGVNIASRLEALAEPGGVFLSGTAFDHVKKKLDVPFEPLGEQRLKNIHEPVRTYRALIDGERMHKITAGRLRSRWRPAAVAAIAVLAAIVGASMVWQTREPLVESASAQKAAWPLPDKPSIAVLPFTNISDDAEQEYFADGMTEDLITDLSKISELFVIARNSTFVYKDDPVDVREVARQLGVKYVLEGSVRRVGDQVRINAQLIDGTTGTHLWAERYDGRLNDVFAVQDDLTRRIVSALAVTLTPQDAERVHRSTDNPEAYELFLRASAHYRRNSREDYAKALDYLERALELDPGYSEALATMAAIYWDIYYRYWNPIIRLDSIAIRNRSKAYLEKALVEPTPRALQISSKFLLWYGKYDEAVAEARKAIALDPNNAESHVALAENLVWSGESREALELIKQARRLDPHNEAYHAYVAGLAEFALGRLEEAAASLRRALDLNPGFALPSALLAATYAHLDQAPLAQAALETYCKDLGACLSVSNEVHWWPFRRDNDRQRLILGLVSAGMAE